MTRVISTAFATIIAIAATAGCGLGGEGEARRIQPPGGAPAAAGSPTSAAAESGKILERLYLIKDGKLVPVQRRVSAAPSVDALVADLLAGPTDAEQKAGLTSSLLGPNLIVSVQVVNGYAIAELAPDEVVRTDAVLAFAQVVCTLTSRSDVVGVYFRRDQQQVGVPRGDGSLSPGPLTASDYASLIASAGG